MSYAGDITPEQAWTILRENPDAVLVDVRTDAEWRFVGVPDLSSLDRDVVYIEWSRTDGTRNDGFVDDLLERIGGAGSGAERPVVFLCRSGNRSIGAAKAATEAVNTKTPRSPPSRASSLAQRAANRRLML